MEYLGRGAIGLDTASFICHIEEHPRFLQVVEPVFADRDELVLTRSRGLTPLRLLQLGHYA